MGIITGGMIRPIREEEKPLYNAVVNHPLQSWEWGEFRKKTGLKVDRIGTFEQGKLIRAFQVSFHPIPVLGGAAGYLPKSYMPDEDQLAALKELGAQHAAVFIKIEPNVAKPAQTPSAFKQIDDLLRSNGAQPGRPLFTRYTFHLDLTIPEKELFANLAQKTRYNVRLAIKKGVTIVENSSAEGMQTHLKILAETTRRQGFYAHQPSYFTTMWDTLGSSGMLRIFEARFQDSVVASWIVFLFNRVLYYPYGASISANRELMASNLLMWEMIRFGKEQGCTHFDMWGALGPNPNPKHQWYGFHRFKEGYGGSLMEYLGTYDVVVNPLNYQLFTLGDTVRWKWLRLRSKFNI